MQEGNAHLCKHRDTNSAVRGRSRDNDVATLSKDYNVFQKNKLICEDR